MDAGTPVGAEAAGDLAKHDGGADLTFRNVVGGGYVAVREEDEELRLPCLDLLQQRLARWVGDRRARQPGQFEIGLGGVTGQRGVLQPMSSPGHFDRPSQVVAKTVSPQSMAHWTSHRT